MLLTSYRVCCIYVLPPRKPAADLSFSVSQRKKTMRTTNTVTSTAVYFPVLNHGIKGLDQCCVCGRVGQFGEFAFITIGKKSGASYCDAHERELLADVRAGEKAAKK